MSIYEPHQSSAELDHSLQSEQELLIKSLSRTNTSWTPIKVLREAPGIVSEVMFELKTDKAEYYIVRRRHAPAKSHALSPRELAIARLIAQGLPNKAIGSMLEISPATVSTYLRRIFSKLGVTSRAAMVARLMQDSGFAEIRPYSH
ncbi:response regulator transcription factor [Leptolyngbya ohadii]|uniref:response regulator transcription factor n=1 Tax=Leptolyngbya ohadii TaxID=1962290 RepID=UPI000B59EB54|nr:LuxR C-terminal-related transcriptional regulator [Leptolyngbya ohadii]